MEELYEIRKYIEEGNYNDALSVLGEMEEMSRDDKINKIGSFLEVLILHIIKKQAEKRSTKSWERSIFNSIQQIYSINKRRKSGGYYLSINEISNIIDEVYDRALTNASYEAFEGDYSSLELSKMFDEKKVKDETIELIKRSYQ
ncbi:MAG: DUF29 family protein [Desulfobacterales bacterium]|nr:DUF29 family protein [Desulfobacterales bacterium]